MNDLHPELIDELAAHYVLGTLRGRARRRFERLLAASPQALRQVGVWEARLAPVALGLDPIAPPPSLRAALVAETRRPRMSMPEPSPGPLSGPRATAARLPRRAVRARRLKFLAAASACGLLLVGGLMPLTGVRQRFQAEAGAAGNELEPMPMVLARLGMPNSGMGWMISLSPDQRKLSITASDDFLSAGRAHVQLWWLDGSNGEPRPLAILGTERDSTVEVDVPAGLNDGRTLVFAISLEPPGSSPSRRPTRPVLGRTGDDAPTI